MNNPHAIAGLPKFNELNVILSDPYKSVPVRVHSKSANQGKRSYHNRIQKKWLKRFGIKWIEIQKRGEVFMLGNHSMVVRKDDWPQMQRALAVEQET